MRARGISKSAQFVQQKAVKFCAAENCACAENVVYCWLWKGLYILGSGHFLADPNGQNVDLCIRDLQ